MSGAEQALAANHPMHKYRDVNGEHTPGEYIYRGIRIVRDESTPAGYWGAWRTTNGLPQQSGKLVPERAGTRRELTRVIDRYLDPKRDWLDSIGADL